VLTSLRQKYSGPGKVKFLKVEVFPARKCFISDIPGFPAGVGDHSLTFVTVFRLRGVLATLYAGAGDVFFYLVYLVLF
jgi:hypothetical protein